MFLYINQNYIQIHNTSHKNLTKSLKYCNITPIYQSCALSVSLLCVIQRQAFVQQKHVMLTFLPSLLNMHNSIGNTRRAAGRGIELHIHL